jgi:hypothetical protein
MKRRKVDPVIEECWRLHDLRDLEAMRRGWILLWREYMAGDRFKASPIETVEAIAGLGAYIAMRQEDYRDAVDCLNLYFAHPHIEQIDPILHTYHLGELMHCLLRLGEEAQALNIGHAFLTVEPRHQNSARLVLRDMLLAYLVDQHEADTASEGLTDLCWHTALAFKRRSVKPQLSAQATYGQLTELLDKTFDAAFHTGRDNFRRLVDLRRRMEESDLTDAECTEAIAIIDELFKTLSDEDRNEMITAFSIG